MVIILEALCEYRRPTGIAPELAIDITPYIVAPTRRYISLS